MGDVGEPRSLKPIHIYFECSTYLSNTLQVIGDFLFNYEMYIWIVWIYNAYLKLLDLYIAAPVYCNSISCYTFQTCIDMFSEISQLQLLEYIVVTTDDQTSNILNSVNLPSGSFCWQNMLASCPTNVVWQNILITCPTFHFFITLNIIA